MAWVEEMGGRVKYKNGRRHDDAPYMEQVLQNLGIDLDLTATVVDLHDCPVKDLLPLADLADLKLLNLSCTQASDLWPLASMTRLEGLDLNRMPVSDLVPLANLHNLRALSLSGTEVADLTPLSSLTGLRTLDLSNTRVTDLSPLSSLIELQKLSLAGTRVIHVTALGNLVKLQMLDLRDTQVNNLAPLAGSNLNFLDLSGSHVSDVASLAANEHLVALSLNRTAVMDLSPLMHLSRLLHLQVIECPVTDEEIAKVRSATFGLCDHSRVARPGSGVAHDNAPTATRTRAKKCRLSWPTAPQRSGPSGGQSLPAAQTSRPADHSRSADGHTHPGANSQRDCLLAA